MTILNRPVIALLGAVCISLFAAGCGNGTQGASSSSSFSTFSSVAVSSDVSSIETVSSVQIQESSVDSSSMQSFSSSLWSDNSSSSSDSPLSENKLVHIEYFHLDKLLDKPVQILHTKKELDSLLEELKINSAKEYSSTSSISANTVELTNGIYIFLQEKKGIFISEDPIGSTGDGFYDIPLLATVTQTANGLLITDVVKKSFEPPSRDFGTAKLLYINNYIPNTPIYFNKTVLTNSRIVSIGKPSDPYDVSPLYSNRSYLGHNVSSSLIYYQEALDAFMQEHFHETLNDMIDFSQQLVITSGILHSGSSVSFNNPDIEVRYGVLNGGIFPNANGKVYIFSFEAYRSDCPQYNPTIQPELMLYTVTNLAWMQTTLQSVTVHSCTPYTQTPTDGSLDWFEDALVQ